MVHISLCWGRAIYKRHGSGVSVLGILAVRRYLYTIPQELHLKDFEMSLIARAAQIVIAKIINPYRKQMGFSDSQSEANYIFLTTIKKKIHQLKLLLV